MPVRVRDVGDGLHAVLVGVRGGARGRRHLQLQLGIDGKLRDVFAHGAAPAQEGAVKVLRRQVAVLRVARGGREPGGPGQAAEQAAQGVAELRGRAAGRRAPQPLRAPQCRGLQEGVQRAPLRARQDPHHQADAPASHGERGEATGVARARSPAVCLGGSPTVSVVACSKSGGCGCYVDFDTVTIRGSAVDFRVQSCR